MKQLLLPALWACLLTLVLVRCVEPLAYDVIDLGQALVVEGVITDQEGPYTIALTWSSQLDTIGFLPVTGAYVRIEEEGGITETLSEGPQGKYSTALGGLRGQIGRKYQLHIDLADGRQYESEWMELLRVPPIDSLYADLDEIATLTGPQRGMQIYLDTRDPENNTRYYRWTWDETWKYVVPYPDYLEFIGQGQNLVTFADPPNEICWQSSNSKLIRAETSIRNQEDVIAAYPLFFVPVEDHRLQIRYSLLVKQYAMAETEYLFWNQLVESTQTGGGLFDVQPQSVRGNVTNLANPGEPVLGYFSASAVAEKRLYINRAEVRSEVDRDYLQNCTLNLDTIFTGINSQDSVLRRVRSGQVFYDFYLEATTIRGYILTSRECSDCTARGGTTEQPDFWID